MSMMLRKLLSILIVIVVLTFIGFFVHFYNVKPLSEQPFANHAAHGCSANGWVCM